MREAVFAIFIFAVTGFVELKPYGENTSSDFSPWAQAHMNEVRDFANKLRNEYNLQASGTSSGMYRIDLHLKVTWWSSLFLHGFFWISITKLSCFDEPYQFVE